MGQRRAKKCRGRAAAPDIGKHARPELEVGKGRAVGSQRLFIGRTAVQVGQAAGIEMKGGAARVIDGGHQVVRNGRERRQRRGTHSAHCCRSL